jgi:hypothetical protein
LFGKSPQAIG